MTEPDAEHRQRIVVEIAIGEREVAAFDYATPRIAGPRNADVFEKAIDATTGELLPGSTPTIHLYFDGDDFEEAREKATAAYASMRSLAQLDPEDARIIGVYLIGEAAGTRWADWLDDAYELFDQQHYAATVIAAQVSCELQIRTAIENAVGPDPTRVEAMALAIPRSYAMLDSIGPRLFEAALGAQAQRLRCLERLSGACPEAEPRATSGRGH